MSPEPDAPGRPDGVVRLLLDRSGRRGRPVTVVRGLSGGGSALEARAAELRRFCAAGGGIREGDIEVQGDHRERLAAYLRARGYRVKLAGG